MKKQILFITILILAAACSNEPEQSVNPKEQNDIEDIKEFVIPNNINLRKELVIAAYYELFPKNNCVIIAYDDTTRMSVKRYSYSSDSTFEIKELVSLGNNSFKILKEPTVSFIVKPTSVVWMLQRGNTAASAEFDRIDQRKQNTCVRADLQSCSHDHGLASSKAIPQIRANGPFSFILKRNIYTQTKCLVT